MAMAPSNEIETEIVIVGGGPVGMGLAIELGQRAIRSIVVERYRTPQPVPKGQNLTQRTMEHFYFWGAEGALRAARTIPREYGIGGMTAYGTLLSNYRYDWLQRELVRPFYFTDNERLPQYATEAVLRRRASELPAIQTFYGWVAEDVREEAAGTVVTIAEHDGDRRRRLNARYVVGCDGSHSLVREQAGISQTHSAHDRLMVLLVFCSAELNRLLARYPGKSFFSILHPDLEGYWKFFGRVDLEGTFFFHAPVPPGTRKDNFDFRKFLHEAAGAEFDVTFEYIGFWDLRIAIAERYRQGRIFIAGDAAHSHPPYGGYGINTGLEDAVNLGWKLAATLQGWGSERLLDSYDEERRPVFESTARDFIEKAINGDRAFLATYNPVRDREAFERKWEERETGAQSEVRSFEPNYEGSSVVWGPQGGRSNALGSHVFTARAGHHLAPQALSSRQNVFEDLGPGFTLLALDASAGTGGFEQAARGLSIPFKILHDSRAEGRERYEASLILVRPDQFVAWAANAAPADAATILGRAVGRINSS